MLRIKIIKEAAAFISLLLFVIMAEPTSAQNADTLDECKLSLKTEFVHFFKDNEFSSEKMSGYTLPGFYFRPRVVWNVEKRVHLEAGIHWLHYWGAISYPRHISFSAFPEMGEEVSASHVLPWMQARVDVLPQLSFVFGSLENYNGHNLPLPLYDPELLYATDPEAGLQILLNSRYFDADIWVDWRDFIFRHSATQERFVFGVSGNLKPFRDSWFSVSVPMHFLVRHNGGEMIEVPHETVSMYNFAGGVQLGFYLGKVCLQTGCSVMGFSCDDNSGLPFKKGWGIYPHIGARYDGLSLDFALWHGDDFVPLLGSPHFSSVSASTPGLAFDPMDILCINADYQLCKFRFATLAVEASSYIYLPYTCYTFDSPKVEKDVATSFSFGFNLKINPKINLLPFAKRRHPAK